MNTNSRSKSSKRSACCRTASPLVNHCCESEFPRHAYFHSCLFAFNDAWSPFPLRPCPSLAAGKGGRRPGGGCGGGDSLLGGEGPGGGGRAGVARLVHREPPDP